MSGHDILIHLAANLSPYADWGSVVGPNIEGAYNAYEAAVHNDPDRVVSLIGVDTLLFTVRTAGSKPVCLRRASPRQ